MAKQHPHALQWHEVKVDEGYYGVLIKDGEIYNTNIAPFGTAEEVHDAVHWTLFPLKESVREKYQFAYIIRVKRKYHPCDAQGYLLR